MGLPIAGTAPAGGLLPLALLAALDRHRWRAMLAGYGWGGTTAEVSAVAAELLRRGVVANVEVHDDDDAGQSTSLPGLSRTFSWKPGRSGRRRPEESSSGVAVPQAPQSTTGWAGTGGRPRPSRLHTRCRLARRESRRGLDPGQQHRVPRGGSKPVTTLSDEGLVVAVSQ